MVLPAPSGVDPIHVQIDALIWADQPDGPSEITFDHALNMLLSSILLMSIWQHLSRYYQHFRKTDARWVQTLLGLGGIIATGIYITNGVLMNKLCKKAFSDYASILLLDNWINVATALSIQIFYMGAYLFYSWRIYKLSGDRKLLLGFLLVLVIGEQGYGAYVLCNYSHFPRVSLETLPELAEFTRLTIYRFRVIGCWQASGDIIICSLMLMYLWKGKDRLFNVEMSFLRKLTTIIFEAMVPPCICVILLVISGFQPHAESLRNWSRVLWQPVALFYFQSTLTTIYSRRKMRAILNRELSKKGIDRITNSHYTSPSSHGGSFSNGNTNVSTPAAVVVSVQRDTREDVSSFHPMDSSQRFTNRLSRQPATEALDQISLKSLEEGLSPRLEYRTERPPFQ